MNILNKIECLVKKRKFHAYCIGAAKTGTTTLGNMFAGEYRTQHEPEIERLNHQIIAYLNNNIDSNEIRHFLRQRDSQLNLDLESSHPLIYLLPQLRDEFPEAKFLVTVRNPWTWLRSRINFHHKVDPPEWREYREYFWMKPDLHYQPPEMALKEHGLSNLDTYLSQYSEHYELINHHLPDDRAFFMRTEDIFEKVDEVAEFLSVPIQNPILKARNVEKNKADFIDSLDKVFIDQKVWQHCGKIIRKFYPELVSS